MGTARPRNDTRGRVLVHRAPCHCEPRSGEAISLSTGTGGYFGHCAPSQRHAGHVLVHHAPCHCEPRSGEAIPLSTGTGGCFGHCAPSQRHAGACSRTPRPLSLRAAKRRSNLPFNWDRRLLATTYSFAPNPLEKQRVFLGVDFVEHLVNFVDQFLHVGL